MKKIFKKSIYLGVIVSFVFFITSCEEDFLDIGSNVVDNTKFDVSSIDFEVELQNSPLERLQSDNITRQLSEYLLGVYNNSDYEKLEASIVSQVGVLTGLKVVDNTYGADTTVVTKIDTVFIKLPYQVSLDSDTNTYDINSFFGDPTQSFTLNAYRSNTYMNEFNPSDPSKRNSYNSDDIFEKLGSELNDPINLEFTPKKSDTLIVIKRRLFDDSVASLDTVKITSSSASIVPIPFGRVPLNKDKIEEIFLDKFESPEFESQAAFNDYFRGIILEASGDESSLVSFDFNTTNSSLIPSIEIYYTNTVLKSGNTPLDTIYKNHSFPLNRFKVNSYKMEDKTYPINNEVKIQGTAGSEGKIQLLTEEQISELRSKSWLINDATLTLYINQAVDTSNVPSRLYVYKNYNNGSSDETSQVKDAYSEAAFGGIGGFLERDASGKVESYSFKITDYISDIVSGEISDIDELKVKVYNSTDNPVPGSETVFNNFSWNPQTVTLFNQSNAAKKPVLKISYSEKK